MVIGLVKGLFDYNKKELNRINKFVDKINAICSRYTAMDDAELAAQTPAFRERLEQGETADGIMVEAFAVAREAADRRCGVLAMAAWDDDELKTRVSDAAVLKQIRDFRRRAHEGEKPELIHLPADFYESVRSLNIPGARMRPFDVQLVGGITLHEGKIAEMKTGEGKTLSATMPVYLNGLTGRGVHVITVNDYLAKRDADWMSPIYKFLGLTVGVIQHDMPNDERRAAYEADITYGTNNEFGFDYLRDNMVTYREHMVQRGHAYAIVDEVDSILIDEARTPLIISGVAEQDVSIYYKINQAVSGLIPKQTRIDEKWEAEDRFRGIHEKKMIDEIKNEEGFILVDEKEHSAALTPQGQEFMEKALKMPDLFTWGENFDYETATESDFERMRQYNEIVSTVQSSIKAWTLYKCDDEYIVKDGQVIIVDEFTGRLMHGRRYSEGLHQAIEAKEGVKIEHESQTLATITFQNYFRLYEKLSGMTGTAKTEESEFTKIYGLNVVVIPTNQPMVRKDHPDVVYKTEKGKFEAVVEEIVECHKRGQPVLVGTVSVEKSERLSKMLARKGVSHSVLNAKYHEKEAEIVSKAGLKSNVTISTNMAGRGTDIKLGAGVLETGGLHIIGTERHESRRIDNQLRGRSGRQGDPGSSRFYISLDDDLMRLFGGDRVKSIMERFGFDDSSPIEHPWITKAIENSQKKVEAHNFEIRKHVLEYDDVMNKQRTAVYEMRQEILEGKTIKEKIVGFIEVSVGGLLDMHCNPAIDKKDWDLRTYGQDVAMMCFGAIFRPEDLEGKDRETIRDMTIQSIMDFYAAKEEALSSETMRELERVVMLRVIDRRWIDHLYELDHLKEGIGLRAYGQVNPVIAYQKEAFEMFENMKNEMRRYVVRWVMHADVQVQQRRSVIKRATEGPGDATQGRGQAGKARRVTSDKIGRNDPCHCGSGKKYKKCCMVKDEEKP
jgi:preprotein translocase subunit SecA